MGLASMIDIKKLEEEYQKISQGLSSSEIFKDRERYQKITKRFSFLEKVINLGKKQKELIKEQEKLKEIISNPKEDGELKLLASEELKSIEEELKNLDRKIENLIFEETQPQRDIIIEIRAAAGGEEAALFSADLFKMYSRYIEKKGWRLEVLSSHPTEIGGFKEVIFSVKGRSAYSYLKFESGVHRVQRVPVTEAGGRIHTSTVTVAVLVEPEDVELKIKDDELKIDTFRASGAGGQHVNRTDSAVRITHLPTGIVVSCQDERSQIKNRAKALRILKAKLLKKKQDEEQNKIVSERRQQVGTGERSEKIRTYNFPEQRVSDHRINLTLYKLEAILNGELDEIIEALLKNEKSKIYKEKGLV